MPNTTSRCFWVTDIVDIRSDGTNMRVELSDDFGKIVLRMEVSTLVDGHEQAHEALGKLISAAVVTLPPHS
jgi:hypothetical protein